MAAVATARCDTDGGTTTVLALRDWTCHTDDGRTVSCPSLDVGENEVCVVSGPSDGRQAAFLDSIAGLRPARGRIAVTDGAWREPPLDRGLVMRLRRPAGLMPHLSVRVNVALALAASGLPAAGAVEIRRALRESELPDLWFDRPAGELDLVQTVSVSLAAARLRRVQLVLIDDVGDDVTAVAATRIAEIVMAFAGGGRSVLVATADRQFIEQAATRMVFFDPAGVLRSLPAGERA